MTTISNASTSDFNSAISGEQSAFRRLPGSPIREYYYFIPKWVSQSSPIVVSVHGISRNAAEHFSTMRDQAERWGAVLIAPLFQKRFYGRYQQLEDSESGARADLALLDILADIRGIAGIAVAPFFLTGFSGGAQFAHRFALYHADQVASCVSCSAGWYSFPDQDRGYPHGMARCSGPGGMSLHTGWLSVAHHVVVGRRDNNIVENLNMSREVVDQQGVGRLRRARRWTRAMNEVLRTRSLGKINLTLIDGLSHDYSMATRRFDLGRTIFKKFLMDGLSCSHRHAP